MKSSKIGVNWDSDLLHQIRKEQNKGESFSRCVNRLMRERFGASMVHSRDDKLSKELIRLYVANVMKIPKNQIKKFLSKLSKEEKDILDSIAEEIANE